MNVIITGTASGIGRAAAERFLREGCDVWGVDVKESALLHPRYHHIIRDIREGAPGELPEAEILINNAVKKRLYRPRNPAPWRASSRAISWMVSWMAS